MERCKNCLRELRVNAEACDNCGALVHPYPVVYFYTPPVYFIPLCLLSFNFYQIYWHYKNWTAVKKAQGIKGIYPFWRAFFCVIFCWSLFRSVHRDAGKYGYKYPIAFHVAACFFMSSAVGLGILAPPPLSLLNFLTSMIALLITQRAIIFHNKHAI